MTRFLLVVLSLAGCDGVFGLQHIPERMHDAADGSVDARPTCTTFASAIQYEVGMGPQGLTITDVDGDGAADIATANAVAGSVTVLRNLGDGAFGARTDLVAEAGAGQVAAARVDTNSSVDLISSNLTAGNLSVYFGNGDGTFQPKSNVSTGAGSSPNGLAVGSFAGTGNGDIAVALASSAKVGVFLWNGTGYTVPPTLDVQLQPSQVVAAKLDGDGTLDLAVTNAGTGSVSIASGSGEGTFGNPTSLMFASIPRALAAAPLAPGGPTSLFVASSGTGDLHMLENDGNASFTAAHIGNVDTPLGIAAGDIDGDQLTDLAVTSRNAGTVTVLDGDGTGTFVARTPLQTGLEPIGVAIADLDGDGNADLVVANQGSNTVGVFLGCR